MNNKNNFYNTFTSMNPGVESQSIYFEKLSQDGLEEMHAYSIDERLYEFFEFPAFKDITDTAEYINKLLGRMNSSSEEPNAQYWFVRNKSDNTLIGSAGLTTLDYPRKSIEWGYGVDPQLWGNGCVLQIQEALKKFVFEDLDLNRLHGITMISNKRTIESVLASGMQHEGVIRDYYFKKDHFIDGWQYSMIKKDYFDEGNISNYSDKTITMNQVISIIESVINEDDINKETSMENTPSWDSLTHMMIMVQLKEVLEIELSPSDISNAISTKAIFDILNS